MAVMFGFVDIIEEVIKKMSLKLFLIFILSALVFLIPSQLTYADYDDFTVNVPNAQGGYTAIVIKKSGVGFAGPQGEYYAEFPTVTQLQAMYNLGTPAPPASVPAVSYIQQPEQPQVTYQVINQAPYEEGDEGYAYVEQPRYQPNIVEVESPSYRQENENNWSFLDFKKKKKSQQPQTNNQNPTKSVNPSTGNSPAQKKKDTPSNGAAPDQKDHGNQPPKDKTIPQNKAGNGS